MLFSAPFEACEDSGIAQLVEQRTVNPRVVGSSPTAGAILLLLIIAVTVLRIAATHAIFSPTYDEPLHVDAGWEFVALHRYASSTDNPPLARAVFAFPLRNAQPVAAEGRIGQIFDSAGDYVRGVVLARRGNLLFVAIAIIGVALFGWRIIGPWGGVIAAALFSLLPPILAHGGLATPDMAGTAAFAMAMFALDCWLERPSWQRTCALGIAIAFGLLTKFSFPLFFIIGAIVWMIAKRRFPWREGIVASVIALVIVYSVYFSAHAGPRFLIGILQVLRNSGKGAEIYFLGELRQGGWWYYFPVILAIKTPIPMLLLAAIGAWRQRLLAILALAILGACMLSNMNYGVRHILPIYVPLSILGAYAVQRLWGIPLAAWLVIGSVLAHPDYLPWMNAFAGKHPERIVVDSNLDWGQDVLRLRNICRERGITDLGVLLFGTTDLHRIGMPRTHSVNPYIPTSGWVAVSETEIISAQTREPRAYSWLTQGRAFERVGKSIRLYRVTSANGSTAPPAS